MNQSEFNFKLPVNEPPHLTIRSNCGTCIVFLVFSRQLVGRGFSGQLSSWPTSDLVVVVVVCILFQIKNLCTFP